MMHNRIAKFEPSGISDEGMLLTARRPRTYTFVHSVRFALQGLRDTWNSQPNFRLHLYVSAAVVWLGLWLQLGPVEWLWVSFAIGLVIFSELMNTAIEQTVDLVVGLRPDPLARQVKDVAAVCVLVAAVIAVVIGGLTLGPHLLAH